MYLKVTWRFPVYFKALNHTCVLCLSNKYNVDTLLEPFAAVLRLTGCMFTLWVGWVVMYVNVLNVVYHGCPFGYSFLWCFWRSRSPVNMILYALLPLFHHLTVLISANLFQLLWQSLKKKRMSITLLCTITCFSSKSKFTSSKNVTFFQMADIVELWYFTFPQKMLNLWVTIGDDAFKLHTTCLQKLKTSFQSLLYHMTAPSDLIALD